MPCRHADSGRLPDYSGLACPAGVVIVGSKAASRMIFGVGMQKGPFAISLSAAFSGSAASRQPLKGGQRQVDGREDPPDGAAGHGGGGRE